MMQEIVWWFNLIKNEQQTPLTCKTLECLNNFMLKCMRTLSMMSSTWTIQVDSSYSIFIEQIVVLQILTKTVQCRVFTPFKSDCNIRVNFTFSILGFIASEHASKKQALLLRHVQRKNLDQMHINLRHSFLAQVILTINSSV